MKIAKYPGDLEHLSNLAIAAALEADWSEALKINKKILSWSKGNIEALNRLARAYTCLNLISQAEKTYRKVLSLDPANIITLKNLEKLKKSNGQTNGNGQKTNSHDQASSNHSNLSQVFLYEPGRTKIVTLLNLAPPQVLAGISCGDEMRLRVKNHAIAVTTLDGVYLGAFPDDLAHRLISLISGGNQYQAYVKAATPKVLAILIRETYRSEKFTNQPSFQYKNTSYFDLEDKK